MNGKTLLLLFALCFSFLPGIKAETCSEDCVAKIGDTKYASINEAVKSVTGNEAVTIEILKDSFLRSVYRYAQKYFESEDELIIESHKRRIKQLEKEKLEYQNKYFKVIKKVYDKYGTFCGAD